MRTTRLILTALLLFLAALLPAPASAKSATLTLDDRASVVDESQVNARMAEFAADNPEVEYRFLIMVLGTGEGMGGNFEETAVDAARTAHPSFFKNDGAVAPDAVIMVSSPSLNQSLWMAGDGDYLKQADAHGLSSLLEQNPGDWNQLILDSLDSFDGAQPTVTETVVAAPHDKLYDRIALGTVVFGIVGFSAMLTGYLAMEIPSIVREWNTPEGRRWR